MKVWAKVQMDEQTDIIIETHGTKVFNCSFSKKEDEPCHLSLKISFFWLLVFCKEIVAYEQSEMLFIWLPEGVKCTNVRFLQASLENGWTALRIFS